MAELEIREKTPMCPYCESDQDFDCDLILDAHSYSDCWGSFKCTSCGEEFFGTTETIYKTKKAKNEIHSHDPHSRRDAYRRRG